MSKDPLIFAPALQEVGFHVEHSPIDQATPSRGSLLQYPVNRRVNNLNWQHAGQLRCRCRATSQSKLYFGAVKFQPRD